MTVIEEGEKEGRKLFNKQMRRISSRTLLKRKKVEREKKECVHTDVRGLHSLTIKPEQLTLNYTKLSHLAAPRKEAVTFYNLSQRSTAQWMSLAT